MPKQLKSDDDELDGDTEEPWEEGFRLGEEGGGSGAKCRTCGKILLRKLVEKEIDDEIMRFCSDRCVEQFDEEH